MSLLTIGSWIVTASPISAQEEYESPTPENTVGEDQEALSGENIGYLQSRTNVITWNMCNGQSSSACDNDATDRPATHVDVAVAYSPDGYRPLGVATQEMCESSWIHLTQTLNNPGLSYRFNRYVASTNIGSDCYKHGNGVFWRGGCGGSDCTHNDNFNNQASPDEFRGFSCGLSNSFNFLPCSAHMTNKRQDTDGNPGTPPIYFVAGAQSQQLREYTTQSSAYFNAFGMGDFNIDHTAVTLRGWKNLYHEGDSCICHWTHDGRPSPDQKLDYIWFKKSRCIGRGALPYIRLLPQSQPGWSDHSIYRAYPRCSF
jgi:hypothetical protein